MMRKYFICSSWVLFFLLGETNAHAQSKVGNINFVVVVSESDDNLSASDLARIESRLTKTVLASGIGASGQSDFIIYPHFEVLSIEVLDGMNPLTVIEAELGLFVKQMSSGKLFSSISVPLRGVGNSKARSIAACIKEIEPRGLKFANFLSSAKELIIEYYESNCETILAQAAQESAKENYEDCIATLLQIPEACTTCHAQAMDAALLAYNLYEEQLCQRDVMKIKLALENSDFAGALQIAENLNPNTDCYQDFEKVLEDYKNDICEYHVRLVTAEVSAGNYLNALVILQNIPVGSDCASGELAAQINDNISAVEQQEYERRRIVEKEELELQKQALANEATAIQAMKEVAIARYKNQPKEIYRTYIYGY